MPNEEFTADNETTATPSVDTTKEYSERLKKDRERIRSEEREALAKEYGYNTWDEFKESHLDNSLLDKGLDPDVVKPLIKDAIENDPKYIEAMKYKAEKDELEKSIWAKNELGRLNDTFGTTYQDISELDENVVKAWNSGMELKRAYAAQNYEKLLEKAREAKDTGKSHLVDTTTNPVSEAAPKVLTNEQLAKFKSINPYATDEQIQKYFNRGK